MYLLKLPGLWVLFVLCCLGGGCRAPRNAFDPGKKYAPAQLHRDYDLFQNILQESHPSVTWYSPADSMQYYFNWGRQRLSDSMTEPQFRSVLSYVISKIHCGHTSTRYSKKYLSFLDTARLPLFPVSIKWLDTDTIVLGNTILRGNQRLPRGTILTSLNGRPILQLADSLSRFIPADGYNDNYLCQTLSNRGAFGGWLRLVDGYDPAYNLGYIDSSGQENQFSFRLYQPHRDTAKRPPLLPAIRERINRRQRREERLLNVRSIQIDTALSTAYMTVNSFNNGYQLRPFFKNSFRELRKENIRHLVIDIRSNGGGNVNLSTLLTSMISDRRFRLADSLYAIRKRSQYGRYIQNNWFTGLLFTFITRKRADGYYHFGFYERHYFKPIKKDHYNGNVYVLTGANSFSAAALFAGAMKGLPQVKLIGEETGGAAYGNTAWFIPTVTLPESGIRFRLPRFRLVTDKNLPKNGRGVLPDIEVKTTRDDVMQNRDPKLELIRMLVTTP
ncbi:MAG: S41 family peptidase [Flavihumibacter sp.]